MPILGSRATCQIRKYFPYMEQVHCGLERSECYSFKLVFSICAIIESCKSTWTTQHLVATNFIFIIGLRYLCHLRNMQVDLDDSASGDIHFYFEGSFSFGCEFGVGYISPISFPPRSHRAIWRPYASGAYASTENNPHFSTLNPRYPRLIFYATGASATICMLPALNKQRYRRLCVNLYATSANHFRCVAQPQ